MLEAIKQLHNLLEEKNYLDSCKKCEEILNNKTPYDVYIRNTLEFCKRMHHLNNKIISNKEVKNDLKTIKSPLINSESNLITLKNSSEFINEKNNLSLINKKITNILKSSEKRSLEEIKMIEDFIKNSSPKRLEVNLPNDIEKKIPKSFDSRLNLYDPPQHTNDWFLNNHGLKKISKINGVSVVIPTFNRAHILSITLASLCIQSSNTKIEVIVVDDGSKEDILSVCRKFDDSLDIKYIRQKDKGFRAGECRNMGIKSAKFDHIGLLDCDMAPDITWLENYVSAAEELTNTIFIGPRKYIDTSNITPKEIINKKIKFSDIKELKAKKDLGRKSINGISKDWRIEYFKSSQDLRLAPQPFKYASSGNLFFSRKELMGIGLFDEEFTHWGGEDNEWAYRCFRKGLFFRSVKGALAYHQEEEEAKNETDRQAGNKISSQMLENKCPLAYRRKVDLNKGSIYTKPMVSIYIPAYNCEKTIERAINSCLLQSYTDLEVCICDDGSQDNTLSIIKEKFSSNPRVKYTSQKNQGIGSASTTAINLCQGFYIGQLDSDDYLFPDAVEICMNEFTNDPHLGLVYTTYQNNDIVKKKLTQGYNFPYFSREKMLTGMIVHPLRMFSYRHYSLISGHDLKLENAVDYDFYLKLISIAKVKHINKVCYERVIHGENTSVKKAKLQKENQKKSLINNLDLFFNKDTIKTTSIDFVGDISNEIRISKIDI